jgi:NAD-dependent dihydropyrimidine dehydrogenase PreA subunit
MRKTVEVDFNLCRPGECGGPDGTCIAAEACTRKLLEQENPYEPPVLISSSMCSGCAKCVRECPLNALKISGGL